MGDMGEVFRAWGADKKAKRRANTESSTDILKGAGIEFQSHNYGTHLVVRHGGEVVDFWPSTGKWIFRSGRKGRGIFPLLKALKECQ